MMQITYTVACLHANSKVLLRPMRYIVGGVSYVGYSCIFCAEQLIQLFDAECICDECRNNNAHTTQPE